MTVTQRRVYAFAVGLDFSLELWATEEQINETFAKVDEKEDLLVFGPDYPLSKDAVAPNAPLPF